MIAERLRDNIGTAAANAKAILNFIDTDLQQDGFSAENKFLEIFQLLCERVFGQIQGKEGNYRHQHGGWLASQSAWNQPVRPQTSITTVGAPISKQSDPTEPVVTLLGGSQQLTDPPPTLVDTVLMLSRQRRQYAFDIDLNALPKPLHDAWMAQLESALTGKPTGDICTQNDSLLLQALQRRPMEHEKLLLFKQQGMPPSSISRQPMAMSPPGFQPMNYSPSFSSPTGRVSPSEEEPRLPLVSLSMIEYYLFLFFRYPLYQPDGTAPVRTSSHIPGVHVHHNIFPSTRTGTPHGDKVYVRIFKALLLQFVPHAPTESIADPSEIELFLRIMITFWLESCTRLMPTDKILQNLRQRRSAIVNPDLCDSYDMVRINRHPNSYPPALVFEGVRELVWHALLDPATVSSLSPPNGWCMTLTTRALQLPLYNFFRANLRLSSIHNTRGSFKKALNIWLLWLEPWNRKELASSTTNLHQFLGSRKTSTQILDVPAYSERSRYTARWESYIASNIYMYVVPLAIFLRRARELDFAADFDKSMALLRRVFRVFDPEVVAVIAKNLDEGSPAFSQHKATLGEFAPCENLSLSSLESDWRLLFEEIDRQGPTSVFAPSRKTTVEKLVERAKVIARLPINAELRSTGGAFAPRKGASGKMSMFFTPVPDQAENGVVSDAGVDEILGGLARANPAKIGYIGDPMHMGITPYESQLVVDFLVWVSEECNTKLGGRWVNLRWFADCRNVVFVVVSLFVISLHPRTLLPVAMVLTLICFAFGACFPGIFE